MREVKQTIVDVRNPTHRVEKKLEEIDETEYGNVTSSEKESQRQLGSDTTLEDDEPLAGEEVEIERTEGEEVKVPETLSRTTSMDGGKGPDESIYLNDGTLKGVLGEIFDVWGSKDEKIDDEEETIENLQKKLTDLKKNLNKAPPFPVEESIEGSEAAEEVVSWLETNVDPEIKDAYRSGRTSYKIEQSILDRFKGEFKWSSLNEAKEQMAKYYTAEGYEITTPGLTIDWSNAPSKLEAPDLPDSPKREELTSEGWKQIEMQDLQKKLDVLKHLRLIIQE